MSINILDPLATNKSCLLEENKFNTTIQELVFKKYLMKQAILYSIVDDHKINLINFYKFIQILLLLILY